MHCCSAAFCQQWGYMSDRGVYVGACRLLSTGWGVGVLYLRRLSNTHPYII